MLKKFLSGIFFGAGFTIVALCLFTIWIIFIFPSLINRDVDSEEIAYQSPSENNVSAHTPNFRELSVDEKIEKSSAILTLRFEQGENGYYRSIVEEVLKVEQGVKLYYEQGDVYEEDSHYKTSDRFIPRRAIVFMQGSPAKMTYSSTFSGDRIRGLGGISLALVREKCTDT